MKDGKPSFELTPAPPKAKPKRPRKKPAAKKAAPAKKDDPKPEESGSDTKS
jgi:ATP-dependent Clp protease ATP-binding subunit ClpA